jgi:hypothetical protein
MNSPTISNQCRTATGSGWNFGLKSFGGRSFSSDIPKRKNGALAPEEIPARSLEDRRSLPGAVR